jgi:twitching motility protein PilU
MQTFDAALFKLHQGGKISLEEAIKNADSANNLRLRIKLAEGDGPVGSAQEANPSDLSSQQASAFAGLSLEKTEEEKNADEKQAIEDAELERYKNSKNQ